MGGPDIDPVALAKALLAQSALRQSLFDGFLREPSWNILLSLYVAQHERAELTQKAVCVSSGGPFSAADRWLREMEKNGLVTRRRGCQDAGDTVVAITDKAAAGVEGLLRDLAAGIHLSDCGLDRHH